MPDLLIENGTVIDGTGRSRFRADVVIEGDRIHAVEDARGAAARTVLDATGKIVCPGFVDIHSHADLTIFRDDHPKKLQSLIRQGITTFLGGNCGAGMAPIDKDRHFDAQKMYLEGLTATDFGNAFAWSSLGDYLDYLESNGVALNVGLLCPHGLLRLQAMGPRNDAAGPDDIADMAAATRRAMEDGAFGLSTGLQYYPGLSSDTRELVEIARELAPFDGRFVSHMRSYVGSTIDRAIDEIAEVARENGIRGHVSHLHVIPYAGRLQRPMMRLVAFLAEHHRLANAVVPQLVGDAQLRSVMSAVERHNASGTRLSADLVPTTTGFTHLMAFLPPWVIEGSLDSVARRVTDPARRAEMIRDIEEGEPLWPHTGRNTWSLNVLKLLGYDSMRIMAVASEKNQHLQGLKLTELAERSGKHPVEAALDLLVEELGHVLVYMSPGEPEDPFTIRSLYPPLRHPEVPIVTDYIRLGLGKGSHLFYGCFPKLLGHYARDKELLSLEAAVRKCTALPAEQMGIEHRGTLVPGSFADVVVFDERTIGTDGDFHHPDVFPRGIDQVVLNGQVVVDRGDYSGDRLAGRVLRRG